MIAALPQGLSEAEAQRRLAQDGPNELVSDHAPSLLRDLLSIVRQPIFVLMFGAAGLYLVIGSKHDAIALLASLVAMLCLALYQQRKTERAVHALKDLSAPTTPVWREGRERTIPSREVVRGDLVLLREGERVPADGVLLDGTNLRIDESLLTGESVPIDKLPALPTSHGEPTNVDEASAVHSGTLVVAGTGAASVRATGAHTAIGRIGAALHGTKPQRSALGDEVARLVRIVASAGLLLCAVLVLAYGLIEHDYLRGLLAGITLAMAILPEEFPVVLTVFTLLGAFRIAKLGVLARRPEAIEALGTATVLCVDKTGTITENKMRVSALQPLGAVAYAVERDMPSVLPEQVHEIVEFAILASASGTHDPMEQAVQDLGARTLQRTEHLHRDYTREQEYPLTRELLAVTHLWRTTQAQGHVVAAKGAPEAIADLCHLDRAATTLLMAQVGELAARGLRVLAVARAVLDQERHPDHPHAFDFKWVGLIGFEDPVRASVPQAMREFARAGVRVVMITGDHVTTAKAIALAAGIEAGSETMTGQEFSALDAAAQRAAATRVAVFARAAPEHKLLIVRALQADGQVVAMTGDGVNDAPALKAAHIGIAVGVHCTDVAREAAALILTNDDFGVIAQAIVLGRRIFDNLRKAMAYLLAVHVPIAGMAVLPVLFGLPPMLFPIHVLFLELIIDPACTIVLEAQEPDAAAALSTPPRRGGALLSRRITVLSVIQGAVLLGAVFGVYLVGLLHQSQEQARAAAFITLVVGNLTLVLMQRSSTRSALATLRSSHNLPATVLSSATVLALACSIFVPQARELFHFAMPSLAAAACAAIAALAAVLWYDVTKRHQRPAAK